MTFSLRIRVAALVRTFSALLVVCAASAALADVGELDITYPYTALGTLGTTVKGASGVENGLGSIKLVGWTFPMGGQTYSQFLVASDGYLAVGTGQAVCGCTASSGSSYSCSDCSPNLPSAETYTSSGGYVFAPPFAPGLIAPLYSTFEDSTENGQPPPPPLGTISYVQGGPDGAHFLIVDWNGVGSSFQEEFCTFINNQENCTYTQENFSYQFQAIVFESGAVVFTYGTPSPEEISSSCGTGCTETIDDYETKSLIGAYFPPPGGNMSNTDAGLLLGPSKLFDNGCMSEWEQDSYDYEDCQEAGGATWGQLNSAYMGELNTPLLSSVPSATGSLDSNGDATVNVAVTITNGGKQAQAAGFPIDYFLVPAGLPAVQLPTTCAGESTCLGSAMFSQQIAAGGTATDTATFPLPNPLPPSGYYAVASAVDPTNSTINAAAPLLEIGTSSTLLAFGQDMTGKVEVTNFSAVNPTEFTVPLQFTNLGLENCITVDFSIYFVNAATRQLAVTGTVNGVGALSTVSQDQNIPIPSSLPAGIYELELDIGPGLPIDLTCLSGTCLPGPTQNNIVLGIQHVENGQDMTAAIDSVPFSIPSPTTFQVPVTFHNLGLQAASNVQWKLSIASADGATSVQVGAGTLTSLAGLTALPQALTATIQQTLPAGAYTLTLDIVGADPSTPDLDTSNNIVVDSTPVFVYEAEADYAISSADIVMNASTHVADGQVVGVSRTIHNLEGPAGSCPYSYFLNPVGVTQVGDGVPVAILAATGPTYLGTTPPFAAFGQPGDQDTETDQIVIPDGMPPGTYNLVVALDPNNTIDDPNRANNDAAIAINVAVNPLQITSPSSLAAAILGTPYVYQLTEAGASGQISWSLLAGALPPGITLGSTGVLSGTPTKAGVSNLVVQLSAGGGTQVAVLQLPVASGAGALQVELSGSALPTGIAGSNYLQSLQAQGGVPPYSWKGTIPIAFNMTISNLGVLAGTPQQATNGPVQFSVVVSDSIGTQASATMTLQIIAPGALTITTPFLQPAVVGTQYDQPILASDGTVTGAIFTWSQPAGTVLPVGMTFQEIGTPSVADLSGVPTQAGIFPLVVNLTDNFGHTASRQYILTVTTAPVSVPKPNLPQAVVGASYAAQLQANSLSTPVWRVFSGQLPPGITLAPTGAFSGTVPGGSTLGEYPFAAAVSDATGAESVLPLEIQVVAAPADSSGCTTGGGSAGAVLFLLGIIWLSRRRDGRRNA